MKFVNDKSAFFRGEMRRVALQAAAGDLPAIVQVRRRRHP
jgi:hypothetical protein